MAQLASNTVDISAENLVRIFSNSNVKIEAKNIDINGAVTYNSLSQDAINQIKTQIVNNTFTDYYLEASTNTVSINRNGEMSPNNITFSAYQNIDGVQ